MNVRASHDTRACDSRNIAQRLSQTSRQGFLSVSIFFCLSAFFGSAHQQISKMDFRQHIFSADQHIRFSSAYFFSISADLHMRTPVEQYSEYT
jgi:hypothetical protein